MKDEFFKISSGLKDLIGSELITDNYVAVFELVKNSFDAKSTKVTIRFENLYTDNVKIIIKDNGKGMDYDDLLNKWLFVAYSAKKDGTEDEPKNRKKIYTERYYGGAKGIGRFSCDRLGKFLNLITIKDKKGAKIENLFLDWSIFEKDQKDEFIEIPVKHRILDKQNYNITHGTILEITGIKSDEWNRENLKKLKNKLSKLIRPDLNKTLKETSFKLILEVPDEIKNDERERGKAKLKKDNEGYSYYNTINGEIRNFVFDQLNIRTTKIIATVNEDGNFVTTELIDRDTFIYHIRVSNKYTLLKSTSITLYFLNRSAKVAFSRKMGIRAVEYGSLFVYKNGFRIYPYGERGDDSLGIDNRAVQGYSRFIGLRNLIGLIDIQGKNDELREATSRDAGLVKTKAYYQLADASPYADSLLVDTLRRLEKYVVDVTQWGVNLDDDIEDLNNESIKRNLVKLISNIADDHSLLSLKYNKDIIQLVGAQEEKSAKKLIKNFKRIAAESNNPTLLKDAEYLEKTLTSAMKAKESAEKESLNIIDEKKRIEDELDKRINQVRFLQSVKSIEYDDVRNLNHIIGMKADIINKEIKLFKNKLDKNQSLTKKEIMGFLNTIGLASGQIYTISNFTTKGNFLNTRQSAHQDIVKYIIDYIENIYKYLSPIKTKYLNEDSKFIINFIPFDISMLIDNIIGNSRKANANLLEIDFNKLSDKILQIIFRDNGNGLNSSIHNPEVIFEEGFTTTNGSGLGLAHVNKIIEELKGKIHVNPNYKNGFELIITLNK